MAGGAVVFLVYFTAGSLLIEDLFPAVLRGINGTDGA